MKKSELKEKLKKESIEWYLSKSKSNYFSAPELFSPLYRSLYESLLRKEEPPYYQKELTDETIRDIHECKTTFDRYLVALFPNRYEASNPLELKCDDLQEAKLLDYFCTTYLKSNSDRESYNIDREIKYILDFIPISESKIKSIKVNARSQLFKLLTLSYKLSIINPRWRDLIRNITPQEMHKASMDNIVDFNMLDDMKARQNSALVKMFYQEIDQGKRDGDETDSRRVLILPFAFDSLFKAYQLIAYKEFFISENFTQIETRLNNLSANFDNIINNQKHKPLPYKSHNQELADLVQTTTLKNIYTNGILARKNFEKNLNYTGINVKNEGNWVIKERDTKNIAQLVERELNHPLGTFQKNWISISETLAKIVIKADKAFPKEQHVIRNLCCILVAHIKKDVNINLRSNITGKKHNEFSAKIELKRAYEWINKNDPDIDDKHSLSILKPTTVHFLTYAIGQMMWVMDCQQKAESSFFTDLDYINFNEKIYNLTFESITKLRDFDHVYCLHIINEMCKEAFGPYYDLDSSFLISMNDQFSLKKHYERALIYWSPLQ